MASQILFSSIDETYPIAGKDNDSQGFRDNFSYIKNGLETAKGEITDLQTNSAVTNSDNDFQNHNIIHANFAACSEAMFNGGITYGTTLIDYEQGPYQKFQVTNTFGFTLTNFAVSGKLSRITVELIGDDNPHVITFAVAGGGSFKKSSTVPATITVNSSTVPMIFEFWTYEGTAGVVFMNYLGTFST